MISWNEYCGLALHASAQDSTCAPVWYFLLFCSVKSCFQNMDICKRRCSAFENGKNMFASNNTPSAATNLTVTFSSQLNQHNQVRTFALICFRVILFFITLFLLIQFLLGRLCQLLYKDMSLGPHLSTVCTLTPCACSFLRIESDFFLC